MRRNEPDRRHTGPLITLAICAVTLWSATTEAKCINDWLSVQEVRDGDKIELRTTNRQDFPISYSLRVRSSALANGRETIRGMLEGGSTRRVTLDANDDDRSARPLRVHCSWTIGDHEAAHDDEHLYRLPYADGRSYRVLQGFGSRFSHRGIEQYAVDFKMNVGTPVHAARAGIVARVVESNDKGCWEDGCGKYANFIVIMHKDGTTGEYYHLQKDGALVDVGDEVVAGQQIGLSGNTGHTALPHLHFAVYRATRSGMPQSVPINFISSTGIVYNPRQGHHYFAVAAERNGD